MKSQTFPYDNREHKLLKKKKKKQKIELFLFTDVIMVNLENPKESIKQNS